MSGRFTLALILASSFMVLSCCTTGFSQETLGVPDDYDTIQAAIDAAEDGDTVLVAEGTYTENLDFLGKAITVVSEDGAEVTTIDGSDPADDDLGACVMFESGEGQDSVLDGFTLTGGSGAGDFRRGGGVSCIAATPIIRNCLVVANDAAEGAGFYFEDLEGDTPALVEDCVVEANDASGSYAGFHMVDANVEIRRTTVTLNDAVFGGGGINASYSTLLVEDSTISNNESGFLGGGINSIGSELTVRRCRIEANEAGSGAGIALDGANAVIEYCVIIDNDASTDGGGFIASSNTETVTITHCTIEGNIADEGAGFYIADSFDVECTVLNSIIYDNDGGDISANDETTVTYSLIGDGYDGDGNIDDDPLFTNADEGDYTLTADSPCIDAGDPDSPEDVDETTADMGALFYDQREWFLRGDCDGNGTIAGLLDALYLMQWAFLGGDEPPCFAAADVDSSGSVSALLDALALMSYWFINGEVPGDPGVEECGPDPEDILGCETPPVCS